MSCLTVIQNDSTAPLQSASRTDVSELRLVLPSPVTVILLIYNPLPSFRLTEGLLPTVTAVDVLTVTLARCLDKCYHLQPDGPRFLKEAFFLYQSLLCPGF
jgi:hypothetical protein